MPSSVTPLPSSNSAAALVRGDENGLGLVARDFIGRAILIGLGMHVAGLRGRKLTRYSLAAAAAIEVFVIGWTVAHEPP